MTTTHDFSKYENIKNDIKKGVQHQDYKIVKNDLIFSKFKIDKIVITTQSELTKILKEAHLFNKNEHLKKYKMKNKLSGYFIDNVDKAIDDFIKSCSDPNCKKYISNAENKEKYLVKKENIEKVKCEEMKCDQYEPVKLEINYEIKSLYNTYLSYLRHNENNSVGTQIFLIDQYTGVSFCFDGNNKFENTVENARNSIVTGQVIDFYLSQLKEDNKELNVAILSTHSYKQINSFVDSFYNINDAVSNVIINSKCIVLPIEFKNHFSLLVFFLKKNLGRSTSISYVLHFDSKQNTSHSFEESQNPKNLCKCNSCSSEGFEKLNNCFFKENINFQKIFNFFQIKILSNKINTSNSLDSIIVHTPKVKVNNESSGQYILKCSGLLFRCIPTLFSMNTWVGTNEIFESLMNRSFLYNITSDFMVDLSKKIEISCKVFQIQKNIIENNVIPPVFGLEDKRNGIGMEKECSIELMLSIKNSINKSVVIFSNYIYVPMFLVCSENVFSSLNNSKDDFIKNVHKIVVNSNYLSNDLDNETIFIFNYENKILSVKSISKNTNGEILNYNENDSIKLSDKLEINFIYNRNPKEISSYDPLDYDCYSIINSTHSKLNFLKSTLSNDLQIYLNKQNNVMDGIVINRNIDGKRKNVFLNSSTSDQEESNLVIDYKNSNVILHISQKDGNLNYKKGFIRLLDENRKNIVYATNFKGLNGVQMEYVYLNFKKKNHSNNNKGDIKSESEKNDDDCDDDDYDDYDQNNNSNNNNNNNNNNNDDNNFFGNNSYKKQKLMEDESLTNLKKEFSSIKDDFSYLKEKNEEYFFSKIQSYESTIAELHNDVEDKLDVISGMRDDQIKLSEKVQSLEKLISLNTGNSKEGINKISQYQDLKEENSNLYQENSKLKEDGGVIYQENLKLKEDGSLISQENSKLKEDGGVIYQENLKLKEDINRLSQENSNFKEDINRLSQDNSRLKEDGYIISQQNSKFKEDINILSQENSKLKENGGVIYQENSKLKENGGVIYQENLKLKEDINRLFQENSNLKENYDECSIILNESFQKIKDHTKLFKENYNSNLETIKATSVDNLKGKELLTCVIKSFYALIDPLCTELASSNKLNIEKHSEITRLNSSIESLQNKYSSDIFYLENQNKIYKNDYENLLKDGREYIANSEKIYQQNNLSMEEKFKAAQHVLSKVITESSKLSTNSNFIIRKLLEFCISNNQESSDLSLIENSVSEVQKSNSIFCNVIRDIGIMGEYSFDFNNTEIEKIKPKTLKIDYNPKLYIIDKKNNYLSVNENKFKKFIKVDLCGLQLSSNKIMIDNLSKDIPESGKAYSNFLSKCTKVADQTIKRNECIICQKSSLELRSCLKSNCINAICKECSSSDNKIVSSLSKTTFCDSCVQKSIDTKKCVVCDVNSVLENEVLCSRCYEYKHRKSNNNNNNNNNNDNNNNNSIVKI